MRLLTRPGLVLAIAVALVALPAGASGALSEPATPSAVAANSVTFTDSTGENPAAPDITTIVVSNNDAGVVQFRINIPNRPTFDQDQLYLLFIDTDSNPATGDPESLGADYVIQVFRGEAALFRWDGTDFTRRPGDPPATSLIFAYQNGLTVTITAAELGNTKRFGFAVIAIGGVVIDPMTNEPDFTNAVSDVAPAAGSGFYTYEVKITPPTLIVRSVKRTPARPVAGKRFTMRLVAVRSDTRAVIQNGKVTCVGRVGSARLKPQVQRVLSRAATCAWLMPPKSKGKRFRASVTVVFEGLRATGRFAGKIR